MANPRIKTILFFGLGAIGQRHLRIIKSLVPRAKIYGSRQRGRKLIVDDDLTAKPGSLDAFYGIQSITEQKELNRLRPDLIFITNPSSKHLEIANQYMKDGIHMIIEKPLGDNLRDAENLLKKSRRTKNAVLVGYQLHFYPLFQEIKEKLRRKVIGKLCSVNVSVGYYAPNFHQYESYRDSYLAKQNLGGGVILTQSHEINSIIELFGMPKSIYALGGRRSRLAIDVEDTVDVLCDYSDFQLTLHMDYLQYEQHRMYKFIGDRGTIELDFMANFFKVSYTSGKTESKEIKNFQRNGLFRAEHQAVLKEIRAGKYGRESLANAVKVLQFSEAIKKSIQSRKIIFLK